MPARPKNAPAGDESFSGNVTFACDAVTASETPMVVASHDTPCQDATGAEKSRMIRDSAERFSVARARHGR